MRFLLIENVFALLILAEHVFFDFVLPCVLIL